MGEYWDSVLSRDRDIFQLVLDFFLILVIVLIGSEEEKMNWMLTVLLSNGQEIVRDYSTERDANIALSTFKRHYDVIEAQVERQTAARFVIGTRKEIQDETRNG